MGTVLAKTDLLDVKCKCMVSGKGETHVHTAAVGSLQFSSITHSSAVGQR